MHKIISFMEKRKARKQSERREKEVLKDCGCICYCPECRDILNDQAECVDSYEDEKVYYKCSCGADSTWTFDAAPIPLLLSKHNKKRRI